MCVHHDSLKAHLSMLIRSHIRFDKGKKPLRILYSLREYICFRNIHPIIIISSTYHYSIEVVVQVINLSCIKNWPPIFFL